MIMAASQKDPCGSLGLHVPFALIDCQVNSTHVIYGILAACIGRFSDAIPIMHKKIFSITAIKFSVRLRQHGLIIIEKNVKVTFIANIWFGSKIDTEF